MVNGHSLYREHESNFINVDYDTAMKHANQYSYIFLEEYNTWYTLRIYTGSNDGKYLRWASVHPSNLPDWVKL